MIDNQLPIDKYILNALGVAFGFLIRCSVVNCFRVKAPNIMARPNATRAKSIPMSSADNIAGNNISTRHSSYGI